MLFNSAPFIFLFLPLTCLAFYTLSHYQRYQGAALVLIAASLIFYAWWNPAYLGLIIGSIIFNFIIGKCLIHAAGQATWRNKILLSCGIVFNLALLAYYKYTNFFIENLELISNHQFNFTHIILPLAISFFTFQQIGYLVDCYRNTVKKYSLLHYSLFVTFFPQLIAGPIVQQKEILPQLTHNEAFKINYNLMAIGISIFTIGLLKKVIIADHMALYANPVFAAAEQGATIHFFEAWGGAAAYSLQLYFDFSGYADMAIGLAKLFGINLPINFNSPYKSLNINDFWRRWHITLGRFLKEYIYIPLGGNRKGSMRAQINLLIVMLISGLWHGPAWTFILWGALHGLAMVCNHYWRMFRQHILKHHLDKTTALGRTVALCMTLMFITMTWVLFRAESFHGANEIIKGMLGLNGVILPEKIEMMTQGFGFHFLPTSIIYQQDWLGSFGQYTGILKIAALFLIVLTLPNTQQIESSNKFYCLKTNTAWLCIVSTTLFYCIISILNTPISEFIYFNF